MSTTWLDDDKFHDECGIFGVFDHPEAANLAYLGLYALQHRGQESAGIAASDGTTLHVEKAMGWVADVFSRERLRRLPGHRAIGHVRYSTAGSSNLRNAQPITGTTVHGPVAIAHNGNLVNAEALREELGDLFFALVNVARLSGIDAEDALQAGIDKFRRRFNGMEEALTSQGKSIGSVSQEELERSWEAVKAQERSR